MSNFQNAKIYRIEHQESRELLYIGSTTLSISKRKALHKAAYLSGNMGPVLRGRIQELGGWQCVSTVLIENYPCVSKLEMFKRERHFHDVLRPTCNVLRPYRTPAEARAACSAAQRRYRAKKRAAC